MKGEGAGMDISGIREAIQAFYETQNRKTAGAADREKQASFSDCIENAVKKNAVFPKGEDVVMSHPPLYATQYEVDMDKPKEEMTMEEYKKYICNVVSGLPVSTGMRMGGSGALIFKEEAFESMKNNPEYEKEVIAMLRETYSAEVSPYVPNVSYQVIGASKEECYGSSIPVKNYGMMLAGLNASGLGLSGTGSLGTLSSGLTELDSLGISSLGLTGAGSLGISSLGLAGLGSLGASFLGLAGLGSLGVSSSGLAGSGSLGVSSLGLTGAGTGNTRGSGSASAYGNSYADMVNAYKKTAAGRNGSTSIREYKSRQRKV